MRKKKESKNYILFLLSKHKAGLLTKELKERLNNIRPLTIRTIERYCLELREEKRVAIETINDGNGRRYRVGLIGNKKGGFIGTFLAFCGVIFLIIVAGIFVAYFILSSKGLL